MLHHTGAPKVVEEETLKYDRVESRDQLRLGTWWHDASQNNLHVLLRAEAKTDRIVSISF